MKKNGLSINELLENVSSITCVLSNTDLSNVITEDIAALCRLSPSAQVKIIRETEIDPFIVAEVKPTEIIKAPSDKDRAELGVFFQKVKKTDTDILYCRSAENNPVIRKCVSKIDASVAIFFGRPLKKAVVKATAKCLRVEDDTATLRNVLSFIPDEKSKRKYLSKN